MAWPTTGVLDLSTVEVLVRGQALVTNLEGPVIEGPPDQVPVADVYKFNLYSDASVAAALVRLNVVACGLANNHISDYVDGLERSKSTLAHNGISVFGTRKEPWCRVEVDGQAYLLYGACSPLPEPTRNATGDAALLFNPKRALAELALLRRENPASVLVAFMHWGYELAQYPQPADREWARQAIDVGVDLVIGHHPHLVQGLEAHGRGVIAYSLGNFALPQVRYRGRELKYKSEEVARQLMLAHSPQGLRAAWLRYDRVGARVVVERVQADALRDPVLAALTPFARLGNAEYRAWFAEQGLRATEPGRRVGPTLWGYRGWRGWESRAKFGVLAARKWIRRAAIRAGLHRPYNW